MNSFQVSFHIPVNFFKFFSWSGKSNEQGITTQDPGRPLIKGGTATVQDLVSVWITAIRAEINAIKMKNGLKTCLSRLRLYTVVFVAGDASYLSSESTKDTDSIWKMPYSSLRLRSAKKKVTHFKAFAVSLFADFNRTHLKYPWRLWFIQVITLTLTQFKLIF